MTLDKALVEALEKDYTTAPISAQDRVMLDHVVKLTKDATKVGKKTSIDCALQDLRTERFCRSR